MIFATCPSSVIRCTFAIFPGSSSVCPPKVYWPQSNTYSISLPREQLQLLPACLGRSFASLAQRAAAISCSTKAPRTYVQAAPSAAGCGGTTTTIAAAAAAQCRRGGYFARLKNESCGVRARLHTHTRILQSALTLTVNTIHIVLCSILQNLHILHHLMPPGERRFPSMKILPFWFFTSLCG